jgi:hypothetical protein
MTYEFAFRAQLVVREQRQLYDYWRSCAETRQMPARGDLDPTSMRSYLPYICLIDIHDGLTNAIVRLAGTRLRDVYGFELTGKCLGDLEWGEKAGYWQAVYRRIVNKAAPLQGAIQGPICNREHITLFWLRLPLSDDGERVNKILCYDVAVPSCSATQPEQILLNGGRVVNG